MSKKLLIAAAIGLVALPGQATAAGELSYEEVANCAAFNILTMRIFSQGGEPEKNKDKVEKYKSQAVALSVVAVAIAKKDSKVVMDDITTRNQAMYAKIDDQAYMSKLIETNAKTCNELGEAAVQALKDK
ncbi:hypothetical protein [Novosphingobium sp.]|uniref:hypothetical protein n=1 Tax=Novosphingobium sp. TaxID=1874826 RepID=UPI0025CF60A9|nr:hypothetical protein [Novosphingobium sp.]MCC6926158.1 hypothetical protein [Novosphingobium sp.]